jgi:hypothetical protein
VGEIDNIEWLSSLLLSKVKQRSTKARSVLRAAVQTRKQGNNRGKIGDKKTNGLYLAVIEKKVKGAYFYISKSEATSTRGTSGLRLSEDKARRA